MRFPQILLMPAAVATVSIAGAYVLVTATLLRAVIVTAAGVVGNVTTVAKQGLFIVIVNGN